MVSCSSHQLIKGEGSVLKCLYCGTDFDVKKWESDHYMSKHYKTNECACCGKMVKMQVDFSGSGDDGWASPMEFDENIKIAKTEAKMIPVESPLEKAIKQHIEKRKKNSK